MELVASVHPSLSISSGQMSPIHPSVSTLTSEQQRAKKSHYQCKVFVCVSNNRADAVDLIFRLQLINHVGKDNSPAANGGQATTHGVGLLTERLCTQTKHFHLCKLVKDRHFLTKYMDGFAFTYQCWLLSSRHEKYMKLPLPVTVYSIRFCPIMILFIGNIPMTLKYSREQLKQKMFALASPPQKIHASYINLCC